MARRCAGNGLLWAGAIVTLIGLVLILRPALGLSREWTTVLIGLTLFVLGMARRVTGRDLSGEGQGDRRP